MGELTFNEAYGMFREQVKALVDGGVDVINFETFTDLAEMRAALLAARETCSLPVICSISFEANGRTLMGTDPYTAAVVLKSLGADMVGTNCSLGPEHLLGVIREMSRAGIYLSVKPNAGLPEIIDGKTVYHDRVCEFINLTKEYISCGVRLIGGCCGTTPELIAALREDIKAEEVPQLTSSAELLITSGTKTLVLDGRSLYKGSLSAAEDAELGKALKSGDMGFVTEKALELAAGDFDYIYINIDSADGDDSLLSRVVNEAQGYIREPFVIDTKNITALENALRIYKGKAGVIINETEEEKMEQFLMAARKYGSTVLKG
jgi:5-methyltetrahydrofolate--homocysteine methyltransferase